MTLIRHLVAVSLRVAEMAGQVVAELGLGISILVSKKKEVIGVVRKYHDVDID